TNDIQPIAQPGDILWVRETWQQFDYPENLPFYYAYKADGFIQRYGAWERDTPNKLHDIERIERWKPSIFMPKEACRIFLKVTNVRVERLNNITDEDAIKEGIYADPGSVSGLIWYRKFIKESAARIEGLFTESAKECFQSLWDSINGAGSWDKNPYVWVYEFERVEKPEVWP